MFKSKSYNVKKESEKDEKKQPQASYSTGTLKKNNLNQKPEKKKASAEEIKRINNKESPEYSRKIYPKKTVTDWQKNKTYSPKNKLEKVVIPSPHKKLERK